MATQGKKRGAAQVPESGPVTVRPVLRRNPAAPQYFTPVIDVRTTDRDLRVMSFVIPAADADEIVVDGGALTLPIRAQCELILPPAVVPSLIEALRAQYRALTGEEPPTSE